MFKRKGNLSDLSYLILWAISDEIQPISAMGIKNKIESLGWYGELKRVSLLNKITRLHNSGVVSRIEQDIRLMSETKYLYELTDFGRKQLEIRKSQLGNLNSL
ncbi:MAG: hypothetical protein AAF902_03605 [Chloroflexota bacterium]